MSGGMEKRRLAGLLERLPLVEHSYRVAAGYAGKPGLHSFQWILGDAIQAAARISHTEWIAICWSRPTGDRTRPAHAYAENWMPT